MTFFALLIVFVIVQLSGSGRLLQYDSWLAQAFNWVQRYIDDAILRLLVLLLAPTLAVLLLAALFDEILLGLLSLVLYVGVLLYSLGRGDFSVAINDYLISWRSGNDESAYQRAMDIGDFKTYSEVSDRQSLHDYVRQAMIYEGYQRWFAVVFWFFVLGPAGALLYRLSYLFGRDGYFDQEAKERQLALQFSYYLDWLPARLLALTFAITGEFEATFKRWTRCFNESQPIPELLNCSASAALHGDSGRVLDEGSIAAIEQGEREINAVQSLLFRSVIAWMIMAALLQLIF